MCALPFQATTWLLQPAFLTEPVHLIVQVLYDLNEWNFQLDQCRDSDLRPKTFTIYHLVAKIENAKYKHY